LLRLLFLDLLEQLLRLRRQRRRRRRRQIALALARRRVVVAELAIDLREVDQELRTRRERVAELELVQRLLPAPARVLLLAGDEVAARQLFLRRRRARRRRRGGREHENEHEAPCHLPRTILTRCGGSASSSLQPGSVAAEAPRSGGRWS